MFNLSDYRTPTPPERGLEPIVIVLSEDDKQTISRHTFSRLNIDIQRDYAEFYNIPNASSLHSKEIFRLLFSENLAMPLHPEHVLIDDTVLGQRIVRRENVELPEDAEPQQLEQLEQDELEVPVQDSVHPIERLPTPDDGRQHEFPIIRPHREPSIPTLQDRVDADGHAEEPHPPIWFQNKFEQLRDQHNDLRTRIRQTKLAARDAAADVLEVSALFKVEEAKLQEVLARVRNIVGPQVTKWIDEDVAASMEAGKLVCRDFSVLDAEFNCSDNEDDDSSKSKRSDGEGEGKSGSHTDIGCKGKGKEKDIDQSYGSNDSSDSSDKGGTGDNIKVSVSRTRSNQRKRSAESQSDEDIGRHKRSKISPPVSPRSPSYAAPSSIPEKPSSPLKRAREAFEDSDDGSVEEVEKSITMNRSFSVLEDSGPISKKARRQGSHGRDIADITASPLPSGSSTSPRTNSHGPSISGQTGTTDSHAGPSTNSRPANGLLFPSSAFPRVRPPAPPERPYEPRAKPLQRDTKRVRANPVTGEFKVFDYELTDEYRERLERERHNLVLHPMVFDSKADLLTISQLDGPRFKFDRDAWRDFEDHTLMS